MNHAYSRFYKELNEFPYSFSGNPSVKDAIETLGVLHIKVDLILMPASVK